MELGPVSLFLEDADRGKLSKTTDNTEHHRILPLQDSEMGRTEDPGEWSDSSDEEVCFFLYISLCIFTSKSIFLTSIFLLFCTALQNRSNLDWLLTPVPDSESGRKKFLNKFF